MERTRVRVASLGTLLLLFVAPAGTQTNSQSRIGVIDSSNVAPVRGTAHPIAQSRFDQGRTDSTRVLSGVSLAFRLSATQQADLDRLLHEQQDPSSTNYHKWLTPDEYAARFGMTQADLAKVTSWLKSQGLTIDEISRNRREISLSGTVARIEHAFHTELHNYTIKGERHFANATDLSFPAAFASQVLGVRNLNDFQPKPHLRPASPHFTSNLSGNHFVEPGDFAVIYNLGPLYSQGLDGSGEKIAVVGQTTISISDVTAFRAASGLPARTPATVLVPNTGPGTSCTTDIPEADLDVEWSGAVAKGATVTYYYAGVGSGHTCNNRSFNVFNALQYVIANNLAPVISISYGNCEAILGSGTANTFQQWAQQANSQGQTISAAAGDDGAADCDFNVTSATHGLAVDLPAAIPEVTGIGGTEFIGDSTGCPGNPPSCPGGVAPADPPYWAGASSLNSGPTALTHIPETAWNDTTQSLQGTKPSFSAGGGGASKFFSKPIWQSGPGVPNDSARDVPDVSLNASQFHDPYLFCTQGSCVNGFRDGSNNLSGVGGTSVGAPAFAGILAIINQATQSIGQGNADQVLYNLAISTPSAFHDVITGDNKVPCTAGSTGCAGGGMIGFTAGSNYDQATGLGSIDAFNLVTAWNGFSSGPGFSLRANPTSVSIANIGQSGSSSITVSASNGFAGSVGLTCAVPSTATANISCSVNPSSVTLSASSTSGSSTLTINALPSSGELRRGRSTWLMASFIFPAFIWIGFPNRKRKMMGLAALLFGLLVLLPACGGGSSTHSKPAVTYSVTVNGTSGAISHGTTVSVTVQ
jgi:subtilase family serine protease